MELTGRLKLSEEDLEHQRKPPENEQVVAEDAQEIIYPGKNSDGWWNAKRLIAQVSCSSLPLQSAADSQVTGDTYNPIV